MTRTIVLSGVVGFVMALLGTLTGLLVVPNRYLTAAVRRRMLAMAFLSS
jgi:hypothetical protein